MDVKIIIKEKNREEIIKKGYKHIGDIKDPLMKSLAKNVILLNEMENKSYGIGLAEITVKKNDSRK